MVRLCKLVPFVLLLACDSSGSFGGGGGGPGGGGGGGNGSDSDAPVDPECSQIEKIDSVGGDPADLLLVVDKSGSMDDDLESGDNKWRTMRDALNLIVGQYDDGINFGLSTYPSNDECQPGSVVTDIAPLAGGQITASLNGINPDGGTPTHTSLDAARSYYVSNTVNPNGRFVLLATDGEPNCGPGDTQTPTVTESVAAVGALKAADIPTFVLGFGGNVNNFPATLKAMAEAGGTGDFFAANNPQQLETALAAIASEVGVVSCTLRLDIEPDLPDQLMVFINGKAVPRDGTDGYSYDSATNSITFHGASCDSLKDGGTSEVAIDLACGDVDCTDSQECDTDNECPGNDVCTAGCCVGAVE